MARALAQALGQLGDETPRIEEPEYFREAFTAVQELIQRGVLTAGHDISGGGLITALLEMCFPSTKGGLSVDLTAFPEDRHRQAPLAENPGVLVQTSHPEVLEEVLRDASIGFARIATPTADGRTLSVSYGKKSTLTLDIDAKRDLWYRSSYLMDKYQSGEELAKARYEAIRISPSASRLLRASRVSSLISVSIPTARRRRLSVLPSSETRGRMVSVRWPTPLSRWLRRQGRASDRPHLGS